jgi:hypothetical protein
MTKVPPFVSYDYQPEYVTEFGNTVNHHKSSIRALGKDGTIWMTFQRKDGTWVSWEKIG